MGRLALIACLVFASSASAQSPFKTPDVRGKVAVPFDPLAKIFTDLFFLKASPLLSSSLAPHLEAQLPAKQKAVPHAPKNPDVYVRLAANFVFLRGQHKLFGDYDVPYVRFFHWTGVPDSLLDEYKRTFGWFINQMSFERAVNLPKDVPDSDGRLQWIDLRDYRWNAAAFQAVAERDPYTQHPLIDFKAGEDLRRAMGITISAAKIAKKEYPVGAVVSAMWLLRETSESDRSPSYDDLLFAERRFVKGKFIDFPKNTKEWDEAFGIDVVRAFGKKAKINLEFGSVTVGNNDDPKTGSIVALHNRILVTINGPYGGAMQSFDTFRTSAKKDFLEQSPLIPEQIQNGTVEHDASELLAYLPNGGQAAFLTDGKGNRAEVAAQKAASAQNVDKRLNQGITRPGRCIWCHGPANGYIFPKNQIQDILQAGIEVKFRDPQKRNDYLAFFTEWEKKVAFFQAPYADLVDRATKPQLSVADLVEAKIGNKALAGWDGPRVARAMQELTYWYDDPVSQEQASAELGIPLAVLLDLCAKSPSARLNSLSRGIPIPRETWESDSYKELSLLIAAGRNYK